MQTDINLLEKRIAEIEIRNKNVETDKAWEISKTRRIILMLSTYVAIGLYLQAVNIDNPWGNAIVPSVGFFLSTLTLPMIKKFWLKHIYK